jgi:hypothetical protein
MIQMEQNYIYEAQQREREREQLQLDKPVVRCTKHAQS